MCRMYAEKHTHIDGSTRSPGEPVGRSQLVGGGSRGKQVEGALEHCFFCLLYLKLFFLSAQRCASSVTKACQQVDDAGAPVFSLH